MKGMARVQFSDNFLKHEREDLSFDCSDAELSPTSRNGFFTKRPGGASFWDGNGGFVGFGPVPDRSGGKDGRCLLFNPTRACRFAAFSPEESRAESAQPVQVPDVYPIP